MIEVFTPRDSGLTAIEPHSLSNTMYINKTRDTPRPTVIQYNRPQSNCAGGDGDCAIVICHFHRIEVVMECVNFDIIMVARPADNYFSIITDVNVIIKKQKQ